MADLKLKLTATEYDQPLSDEPPLVPGQTRTTRIIEGQEFEARSQEEYDRLVDLGAAVSLNAPDPDDPTNLKGDDLAAALEFYGLSTEGRADDKRARIAAHLEANPDAERYQPSA